MIDLRYTIAEEDFLAMNLYLFEREGKLRKITRTILLAYLIAMAAIGTALAYFEEYFLAASVAVAAICISLLNKRNAKRRYLRLYKKLVQGYASRFDKEFEISIDDQIHTKSVAGASHFHLSQISFIVETEKHFFIKLLIECIVIPKSKLTDAAFVRTALSELSKKLDVAYVNDLNWKW